MVMASRVARGAKPTALPAGWNVDPTLRTVDQATAGWPRERLAPRLRDTRPSEKP